MMIDRYLPAGGITDWRFARPAPHVPIAVRSDLLDRMTRDPAVVATFVVAPAGFGKTSLLATWYDRDAEAGRACIWLTLADADQDVAFLAATFASALRSAGVGGNDIGALAKAVTAGDFSIGLATALEMRGLGSITVFVDGYERIAGSTAAHWIADVALRLAGRVRWAIAARIVSLGAFSPLRVQGLLQVFTDDTLRLSARETGALLARRLSRAEREMIDEKLEGWPIAVQALRQALADGLGVEAALAQLIRGRSMMSDYIEIELLAPLSPDSAAFLLDVSILSEIDHATADLVRNRADSRRMIAALGVLGSLLRERGPGRWRLHPLLRQHLEALFEGQPETDVVARRMAAARLLIARQDYVGAVRNALLAGNPRDAVELIGTVGPVRLWTRFGLQYMRKVMAMLPADLVGDYPAMRMGDVILLVCQGRVAAAANLLADIRSEAAQRLTDKARLDELHAEMAGAEVLISLVHDCVSEATLSRLGAYSAATTNQLSDELAMELASLSVVAHQQWGELDEAERIIPFARQMVRRWESNFNSYFLDLYQGWIVQARGHPGEAIGHYRQALSFIGEFDDLGLRSLGEAMIAEALYASGDFKGAAEQVETWMTPLERSLAWYDFFAAIYVTAAMVRFRDEGINAGLAVVERMRILALDRQAASLLRLIAPLKLMLLTRAGSWRTARLHITEHTLDGLCDSIPDNPRHSSWRERDLLRGAMAEYHIGTGNLADARTCIERLAADAGNGGRAAAGLTARLLRAALIWRQGARGQAIALLGDAIEDVLATGQTGLLLTQAYLLEASLTALRQAKIVRTAAARRLLDTLATDAARRKAGRSGRLTPREYEVLTLVGAGDSNKTIARRLEISENTVKFHLKRIAVKADTVGSSRVSLVPAARRRGIFS